MDQEEKRRGIWWKGKLGLMGAAERMYYVGVGRVGWRQNE